MMCMRPMAPLGDSACALPPLSTRITARMSGPVEDLAVYYLADKSLADGDFWPNYYKGSEFRVPRDKDMVRRN
jgi:hypothetical protein